MLDDVLKKIAKLNNTISNYQGKITGANARITVNQSLANKLENEIEELRFFLSTVKNSHQNFNDVLDRKKSVVKEASNINNMDCANEYYQGMTDRLKGIRPTSTNLLFSSMESVISAKISGKTTELSVVKAAITADRISIGDWNGIINNARRDIKRLKESK